MSSVGKICLYCSKPVALEDRVACCDRCYAAHHEACWERNGRCSTFRCAGMPRTMWGADLTAVLQTALERANESPLVCPFCASKVFLGALQGRIANQRDGKGGPGLLFVGKGKPNPHKDWFGKHFLDKMLGNKSWFLPGGQIKARSCGKCRRLFLWGVPVDEAFLQRCKEEGGERFCPHCATPLWAGQIVLKPNYGGAQFECADVPDFHADWFGHNVLDRLFLSKWRPAANVLPAHSCPDCQYTEVAGRPIYRFL